MSTSLSWRVIVCLFLGHVRSTSPRAVLMVLYLQGVILELRITPQITRQTSQDGLPLAPQQKPWQQLSQLLLSEEESSSCGKLCSTAGWNWSSLRLAALTPVSFVFLRCSALCGVTALAGGTPVSLCTCGAGGQARDSGCPWSSVPLRDTAPKPRGFPRAVSEAQLGFAAHEGSFGVCDKWPLCHTAASQWAGSGLGSVWTQCPELQLGAVGTVYVRSRRCRWHRGFGLRSPFGTFVILGANERGSVEALEQRMSLEVATGHSGTHFHQSCYCFSLS